MAPSALIDRVRRGEIVPADQIEAALATDYAPAELGARRERRVSGSWPSTATGGWPPTAPMTARSADSDDARPPCVLACVAPRPGMEDLIRRAAALAAQVDGEFLAATVTPGATGGRWWRTTPSWPPSSAASWPCCAGTSPAAALAAFARERRVSEMVLARSSAGRPGRFPVLREAGIAAPAGSGAARAASATVVTRSATDSLEAGMAR